MSTQYHHQLNDRVSLPTRNHNHVKILKASLFFEKISSIFTFKDLGNVCSDLRPLGKTYQCLPNFCTTKNLVILHISKVSIALFKR